MALIFHFKNFTPVQIKTNLPLCFQTKDHVVLDQVDLHVCLFTGKSETYHGFSAINGTKQSLCSSPDKLI